MLVGDAVSTTVVPNLWSSEHEWSLEHYQVLCVYVVDLVISAIYWIHKEQSNENKPRPLNLVMCLGGDTAFVLDNVSVKVVGKEVEFISVICCRVQGHANRSHEEEIRRASLPICLQWRQNSVWLFVFFFFVTVKINYPSEIHRLVVNVYGEHVLAKSRVKEWKRDFEVAGKECSTIRVQVNHMWFPSQRQFIGLMILCHVWPTNNRRWNCRSCWH